MRVLHVTEAMGGGIITSLLGMVRATPEIDHHIIARARPGHDTGDDWPADFGSVRDLPGNPALAVRAIRRAVRDLYPDVVHAHSSLGGVLARVAGLDRTGIVYSPHCFAFERRDISGLQRRAYELAERALARRTDLFVAVAPHEIDLAAAVGHHQIAYIPNRAFLASLGRARPGAPMRVVTTGRISPQKDWRYLLHVKQYAEQQLGVHADWMWLGGGDREGEDALRAAGVDVTGWLDHEELLERLADAQVYLHTAAWEAAPISIFEAATLGLPLVVRGIPPLASLDLPGLAGSVKDLAEGIARLRSWDCWDAAQAASLELAARHSPESQARHLNLAYARVVGAPAPVRSQTPQLPPANLADPHHARPVALGGIR